MAEMTVEEANKTAVVRLGPQGYAEKIGSDQTCVIGTPGKIHGFGSTFEEAFQMLDRARMLGAPIR